MMLNKAYQFDGGTVTPLKPDVILVSFDKGDKITRDSIQNARDCKSELIGSTLHGSIIDCTDGFGKFSAEAKSLVLSNIDPYDKNAATILMVSNTIQKMEVSIFLKLYPTSDNIQIAKSRSEAMEMIRKEIISQKSMGVPA